MTLKVSELKEFARQVRIDVLNMVYGAKSGHIGGALSAADILTVLYNNILKVPKEWNKSPEYKNRDRFILSKGHASSALYSVLAHMGFFDTEELKTFRHLGSRLQGHPSTLYGLQGIETSTGSLGQGLSIGVGMAIGLKLDGILSKVYVMLGDGEMQEGSVWEALMQIGARKLNNIVIIVDKNNLQIDGNVNNIKTLEPLDKKLQAFGFEINEICGHDFDEIECALNDAKLSQKPYAIIANTIKGKGVSFMENNAGWHGKAPNKENFERAIKELENV